MTRKFLHIVFTILFLAETLFTFSQGTPLVRATVDHNQILIGERIQLLLEVNSPPGSSTNWFSLDSIPHFEFIGKNKIDSITTQDGKAYRQTLTITSFDSGTYDIPALAVTIDNKKYFTDSIPVQVDFSKFDPKQDYHDIKDILDIENPAVKFIIWIVVLITLISAGLFIYLQQKRKAASVPDRQPVFSKKSPYEEAMESLKKLKEQKLPESGHTKLFYTKLNDILRLFVMRQLQIASLEKTNEDLILLLRQLIISGNQFSQLAESLRMSDFVKFAKYTPGKEDNDRNFEVIESSITLLNEIENK
ncbi:MAG TPA: BatD family protein [Puia sp.]|nr:BatD family protein [Puia sp.]